MNHELHPTELLPWYVNGTLDESAKQRIEQHLTSCTECQQEVGLLRLVRTQVKQMNKGSELGELAKYRLLHDIRLEKAKQKPSNQNRWRALSAIAAAVVIVVQSGVIVFQMVVNNELSENVNKPNLMVQFSDSATLNDINRLLMDGVKGRIIEGPIKGTQGEIFYEIAIADVKPKSPKAIEKVRIQNAIRLLHENTKDVVYVDSIDSD